MSRSGRCCWSWCAGRSSAIWRSYPTGARDLLRLAFLAEVKDYATLSELLDMPVGSIGPTRRRGLEKMRNLLEADDDWRLVETA